MNNIRKERTRELYIDIVCDLISKEGMSAVSIRNISERAGYNSATLYSYFTNLPELILCAQLRFEEKLLTIFKNEIEDQHVDSFYLIWPHMYALMAQYYLENPNFFDCGFVSDFAGNNRSDIREKRNTASNFQKYTFESLSRISKETGKEMPFILKINNMCLAQVAGTVLLYTKSRMDTSHPIDIQEFERDLRRMIECFMEDE